MAIVCTFCGHELPRDDAQFCNKCGMLVPSHPFSSQSLSAANSATSATRTATEEPDLREQMVQQPIEKPVLREQMVQQPRPRTTRRIAPDNLSAFPIEWPAPITHVSVKDVPMHKEDEHVTPPESQPVQIASSRPASPERELHVKVWEQNNPPTPLPESTSEAKEGDIEDAPTSPLERLEQQSIKNPPSQHGSDTPRDGVEHLDTVPMPNYTQSPQHVSSPTRSRNGNTPLPSLPAKQQQQGQPGYANTPIPYSSIPQQPMAASQSSQYAPAQRSQVSPVSTIQEKRISAVLAPHASPRQKSRVPFIILLALFGILVLGGGAWVLLAQPFNISPITQPLQNYKDTSLGITLSYPNSWTVQHTASSVLFADSSHTAQVRLTVANDTSDAARYVQQQATKSGMTAIKSLGSVAFAGLSWQEVQGNLQQDGANYTTTMLTTVHGSHMYVLTQMAPQNVYADEESVVFSAMRNSFKFL